MCRLPCSQAAGPCVSEFIAAAHALLQRPGSAVLKLRGQADAAAPPAQVPIIQDGDKTVNDSFAIAQYLERTYPDRPSLFGGPGGAARRS